MNIGFKTAMDIDHGYNADAREEAAALRLCVNADSLPSDYILYGLFMNQETAAIYDVRSAGTHSFRAKTNALSMRDLSQQHYDFC